MSEEAAAATADDTPVQIAGYVLERELGAGAFGRVWLARETHPPRAVALKLLSGLGAAAAERFRREAQSLARLEHPGIARIYAAGEADFGGVRLPWLALEYVPGKDLLAHADDAKLDVAARVRQLVALARAVHYAHGRGVIHRDLKPANVLVAADGQPKVLDFGVARLRDTEDGAMTQAGQVLGSLPYMSPEQLSGAEADARSDVYALGAVAYELLSGRTPYPELHKATLFEALDVVRRGEPPALGLVAPACRGDLDRVVMKALAPEPALRYASAGEFAADLERVLEHRPVEARAPTWRYVAARYVRRHRALSAAAAIVLLALVGATAVSLRYAVAEAAARREADERAQEAGAVSAYLERMLTSADPEQALGRDLRVREILDSAAAGIADAHLAPGVAARLQRTLGRTYLQLGDGAKAAPLFEAAQKGTTDAEVADELVIDRAEASIAQNDYAQARTLLDGVLGRSLSAAHRIEAELTYAHALAEDAKAAEAETRLRRVIPQAVASLGPDHALTLTARHDLAAVLQKLDRLDDAAELEHDVLARRTSVFGADHPQTLFSSNHLAAVYQLQGKSAEAEALFRSTLEARRRVLGTKHPSTLTTLQNLAVLEIQGGRAEAGIGTARELLASWRELRGDNDAHTLNAKNMLAYALEDHGDLAAAEALLREVVATQIAQGGPTQADMISPRNNLGMLLMKQGRPAEALVEFDAVAAWTAKLLGPDHVYAAIFASNRGECLAQLGRLDEARSVLEASHARLVAQFGAQHARARTAAERLAGVYDKLHQPDKARELRAKPAGA